MKQGCVDGNIHSQLPGFRLFGSLRTAAGARSATASRYSSVESVIIGGFATNFGWGLCFRARCLETSLVRGKLMELLLSSCCVLNGRSSGAKVLRLEARSSTVSSLRLYG